MSSQQRPKRKNNWRHGHGWHKSPTYRSWLSMKARVLRGTGRGKGLYYIGMHIADRWFKFENFLADMGERPAGTSLDRIDNAKGYEPGNCRWATRKVQGSNRACVEQITFRGKTQNPEDWARELGLKPQTIRSRIKRGWDLERVLTAPAVRGTPGERGRNKLTEAQAIYIKKHFRKTGPRSGNGRELSEQFNISRTVIYQIAAGNIWKHLK